MQRKGTGLCLQNSSSQTHPLDKSSSSEEAEAGRVGCTNGGHSSWEAEARAGDLQEELPMPERLELPQPTAADSSLRGGGYRNTAKS